MLRELSGVRVYVACGYTDLRGGIDKLAGLIQQKYQLDPLSRSLYLFCGRKRDRIKGLLLEGDGFLLLYKRYESEGIQWPGMRQQDGSDRQRGAKDTEPGSGTR